MIKIIDKILLIIARIISIFIIKKDTRHDFRKKFSIQYFLDKRTNKIEIVGGGGYFKNFFLKRCINVKYAIGVKNNIIIINLPCINNKNKENLKKIYVSFYCSDNKFILEKNFLFYCDIDIGFYNDSSILKIGSNTGIAQASFLISNQNITIGNDCMFAGGIKFITDGHSVLDYDTKEVINKSKHDIIIGNHVWVCADVTFTKNTIIPDDCIVANNAVVTKEFTEKHCIIGGFPAKVIKSNITWNGISPSLYNKDKHYKEKY